MAEVFISYSQKERELVAPIAARLAELGVEAWFDREIPPGISFGKYIRDKLDEAKVALVCWSTEAVKSEWVDSEADSARERGIYVPVYVTRCRLQPPFNRIQTEDLSTWNGAANDPTWLKVVDQIAKLLGRDGVAAAARAHAAGDDQTLYEFAKRYSDEPAARSVWRSAETRHRKEFETRLEEARTAAAARAARISAEASDLDARIETTVPAFEAWLADERRGAAAGPKPDPLAIVKRYVPAEERKLLSDLAALSRAGAQARRAEEELEAAKAEISRLSEQSDAATSELAGTRDRVAAQEKAKFVAGSKRTPRSRIWPFSTLFVVAAGAGALSMERMSAPGTERLNGELAAKAIQVTQLQRDLDGSRSEVRTAENKISELVSAIESGRNKAERLLFQAANNCDEPTAVPTRFSLENWTVKYGKFDYTDNGDQLSIDIRKDSGLILNNLTVQEHTSTRACVTVHIGTSGVSGFAVGTREQNIFYVFGVSEFYMGELGGHAVVASYDSGGNEIKTIATRAISMESYDVTKNRLEIVLEQWPVSMIVLFVNKVEQLRFELQNSEHIEKIGLFGKPTDRGPGSVIYFTKFTVSH